jgi:pimeloyl-ACP methyl ester carboxylesterase
MGLPARRRPIGEPTAQGEDGMATFALLHGASSDSWFWHRVVPELEQRGHGVVAPDLPCDDDGAGFDDYADAAAAAIDGRPDVVLVAQSMAGFTAPLVCQRTPVTLMVLLAAMVPRPGESGGDWWTNTGWDRAHRAFAELQGRELTDEFDLDGEFLHDLPPNVRAGLLARGERHQSGTAFEKPWPLDRWPDVPTRFLLCRDDRFFPAEFQRRVVGERLGMVPDEMDGGHLVALSRPVELAERLDAYARAR